MGALAWEQRRDLFGLLVSERRNNGPNWRNGAWTKLIRMRRTDRVPRAGVAPARAPRLPEGPGFCCATPGGASPMPARIAITDDLLWLLGLYVAEGSCRRRAERRLRLAERRAVARPGRA